MALARFTLQHVKDSHINLTEKIPSRIRRFIVMRIHSLSSGMKPERIMTFLERQVQRFGIQAPISYSSLLWNFLWISQKLMQRVFITIILRRIPLKNFTMLSMKMEQELRMMQQEYIVPKATLTLNLQ